MKVKILLLLALIPVIMAGQTYQKHELLKDRLSIYLSEGVFNIIPLSDKAIRIQWDKGLKEDRELVFINKLPVPAFKVSETSSKLKLSTAAVTAIFDKQTGAVDYSDNTGKVFL